MVLTEQPLEQPSLALRRVERGIIMIACLIPPSSDEPILSICPPSTATIAHSGLLGYKRDRNRLARFVGHVHKVSGTDINARDEHLVFEPWNAK